MAWDGNQEVLMAYSLVRGKYVISKVTGPNSAVVISDGAVQQQDGQIIEVGGYQDLRSRYPNEEIIGLPTMWSCLVWSTTISMWASRPFRWAPPTCL